MKLIIIVPCLNEENTLPLVINSIPQKIEGITKIETLIVDDGSRDKTVEVAKKLGVTYIVKNLKNKGLAKSFSIGIDMALKNGADIIVNTDGDNQYPQEDIPRLIKPIIDKKAEIVIADRQTSKISHFSPLKKLLQKFGSSVVNKLAGIDVPDAVSGFRAYSKKAAMQLNVVTDFSYCTETIIQAGKKRMKVVSVAVITNPKTRESRLFKNMWQHMIKTSSTMIRVFAMYEPLKTFFSIGVIFLTTGTFFFLRFFYFMLLGNSSGHIQSIVFGAVMFLAGFQIMILGLVSDLIASNRKLVEEVLLNQKEVKYDSKKK